jgi:lauroyl/myristoyl acyltransferase
MFPVRVDGSLMCTSTQGASVTTLVDVLPLSSFRNLRHRFRVKLNLSKFLQLRFNLFLMSMLPISATKAYIWMLVRLYFLCRPGKVWGIRRNLARAMKDRTPSEIRKITGGVIRGMIQHYQEKMFNGFLPMPKYRKFLLSNVSFDEYEHVLRDALKAGRGVIIATGHYGALELLPLYLGVKKFNTSIVAKFTTERLKSITLPRAEEDGVDIMVPGDVSVFGEACKALRQNKVFVIQCDETEEWHADRKHTMQFLGERIHPDRMLKVLCKRTGAVLLLGLLQREGKKRYKLLLHRVPCEGDVPINVRTLKLLENHIYQHPDQWYEWKKYGRFASAS